MSKDLLRLAATELMQAFRDRRLSPVEVVQTTFAHIAATNPGLNAFQHLDGDGAMVQARASEARWQRGAPLGPVDGVPTTIKDNVLTIGWPTLSGSRTINPGKA